MRNTMIISICFLLSLLIACSPKTTSSSDETKARISNEVKDITQSELARLNVNMAPRLQLNRKKYDRGENHLRTAGNGNKLFLHYDGESKIKLIARNRSNMIISSDIFRVSNGLSATKCLWCTGVPKDCQEIPCDEIVIIRS